MITWTSSSTASAIAGAMRTLRCCTFQHIVLAADARTPTSRYHNVLFPITQYVCELIPDAQRDSTRVELYYEGALQPNSNV